MAWIEREIEQTAVRWLRRHGEREFLLVDATSFAFMRANRIRRALAFEGDFQAAGFVELRPQGGQRAPVIGRLPDRSTPGNAAPGRVA